MILTSIQLPRKPWPPLVTAANRPVWIVTRDLVLTLIAWGLLAWMLRDPIYVAYDYLRFPVFHLTTARPLDVKLLWLRLDIFFITSGALIAILFVAGVIDRHRLRAATYFPQPPPLTTAEQAEQFKLDEFTLQAAHHFRIIKVHYTKGGRISSLEPADSSLEVAELIRNSDVTDLVAMI